MTVTMVTNSTLIAPAVKVKTTKNHSIFYSIYLQYSILPNPSHSKVIFASNISLRQNQWHVALLSRNLLNLLRVLLPPTSLTKEDKPRIKANHNLLIRYRLMLPTPIRLSCDLHTNGPNFKETIRPRFSKN